MSEKMNDEKINVPEIIDKIPVAVGWKKHGGNGYKSTMDTTGNAYIGRNKKGTLVLYIVIHSKFGMYQIQINKKRMYDMLKNVCKKDANKQKQYEDDDNAIIAIMGNDVHFNNGIIDGQKAYTDNKIHLWDDALAYCVMNSEIGNNESLKDLKYRYNMGFLRGYEKHMNKPLSYVYDAIKVYIEDTGEFAMPEEKLMESMMDKYQLETQMVERLVYKLSKRGMIIRPCEGYLNCV